MVVIGFMYRGLNFGTISAGQLWSANTVSWVILGLLLGAGIVYERRLLEM
jgi:hypothetical protein